MEEETEVLDWDNGDEPNTPEPRPNYTAQDDDDRVSLGGDEEDEDEYFDSRKVESNVAEPSPSVETSSQAGSQQQQGSQPPEAKPPHAETPHSSQTHAQIPPKSPVAETIKINLPLVHALPPKPVTTMLVKRRDIPSSTAATAMRTPNVKEPPLPPDWEVRKSRSGAGTYYYNIRTFETSWIHPTHDPRPSRSSDYRNSDSRGSGERAGNSSRNRRPPPDLQPSEDMSYEDRHYRPGERTDEGKEPQNHNRSRTPPDQWSREEVRRHGSRRASSLERSSSSRHQTRDAKDSGRGQPNTRDESGRSKSTRDPPPNRNEQARVTDTYIPSTHEPKSRGRSDGPQMRSGSPPAQQSSKPRPRSPDSYPPIQTRPAETSDRKREGRSSRFSQAALPPNNALAQVAMVMTSIAPTEDIDPYVPDDLVASPSKATKDDQETRSGEGGQASLDTATRDAQAQSMQLDYQSQSLQQAQQIRRPPLPPQAQSFHKAKHGARQRISRSASPRPNAKRNDRRAASPPPSVSHTDSFAEPKSTDERLMDPNLSNAPRGPRYMVENNMVDRDRSTFPPPTAPTGPAAFGERKRRGRDDLQGAPSVPRSQGKFNPPSVPIRFNDRPAISGSNNTPLPPIRRYGSGQVSLVPRSDYPPAGTHTLDEAPVRQRENRRPDLSLPPPAHFDAGIRQGGPRRERRGSLSDRYNERRPPPAPTSISAGPLRRDPAPHLPYAYEQDHVRLSPSSDRTHRPPVPQNYDRRYDQERERVRLDQDERFVEQRSDYREDWYRRGDSQQSSQSDRYEDPRTRDGENGITYPHPEQDERWGPQPQERSSVRPLRAKHISPTDLRSQDGDRLPPPREWGGRESDMNVDDLDNAPRTTSLLERMSIKEQLGDRSASLQERVQVPTKREREGGRPNDDEEMAKRRRRNNRRSGGRRNQAMPPAP